MMLAAIIYCNTNDYRDGRETFTIDGYDHAIEFAVQVAAVCDGARGVVCRWA